MCTNCKNFVGFKETRFNSSYCPGCVSVRGKGCDVPGVSSQGGVMQRIEAVVIGDGDIGTRLQKN